MCSERRWIRCAALTSVVVLGGSVLGGFAMGGCAMERTVEPDAAADAYGTIEGELDFWDAVAERRLVTNDDVLHGLLLLAQPDAVPGSFVGRLAVARARGWVPEHQELEKNESAEIGLVAVAACDLLDIEGGLTMRLFGPSPRYCTRELIFLELIPRRTEDQAVSGLEFIDLVGRIEDRQIAAGPLPADSGAEEPSDDVVRGLRIRH